MCDDKDITVQPRRPQLTARQMEELAQEMGSSALMKAADIQYRIEQELMRHRIGRMTMKVVDGKYYHYRPHGWVEVRSLADIVFEDVKELPISHRVKSIYPCRVEFDDETHRINVEVPCRGDLTQKVLDERIALALSRLFATNLIDVMIAHRDEVTTLRVTGQEDVHTMDVDLVDKPVGGARTISLEV